MDRLRDWGARVNRPQSASELKALRVSVQRGRPFGDERWVRRMTKRFGMEATFRPRGRPLEGLVRKDSRPLFVYRVRCLSLSNVLFPLACGRFSALRGECIQLVSKEALRSVAPADGEQFNRKTEGLGFGCEPPVRRKRRGFGRFCHGQVQRIQCAKGAV